MKKVILLISIVLIIAVGCVLIVCNNQKNKNEELPNYYVITKTIERFDNNQYKVKAIVQNLSNKDINYSYIVSTAYNSKKEYLSTYVLDNKDVIKANEKKIVAFDAVIDADDVQNIHFDLLDQNEKMFPAVAESNDTYKELFTIDDYQYAGGDISIEYQNINHLKINNLELTVYDEDGNIVCISYINDPKLTSDNATTYTFKCDEPITMIKNVELKYN